MKTSALIFPHQLHAHSPLFNRNVNTYYIIEEYLFFKQYSFHKIKLAWHRATMYFYAEYLKSKNFRVEYISSSDKKSDIRNLLAYLRESGCRRIITINPTDDWLEKRIRRACLKYNLILEFLKSPLFLTSEEQLVEYENELNGKNIYHQHTFYVYFRKKLGLLLHPDGTPLHGKWSFDTENRKKLPAGIKPPVLLSFSNGFWKKAINEIEKEFISNPGILSDYSPYPLTFDDSKHHLEHFINYSLCGFGPYQDAIDFRSPFLFHSNLSCVLNNGMLDVGELLNAIHEHAAHVSVTNFSSLEGFVRQIVGWREYIRWIYWRKGTQQRNSNFWKFEKDCAENFFEFAATAEPFRLVLEKIQKYAYAHHIERLMLLGNAMLLFRIHPHKVYEFFMIHFIDAYDWVMVPNVYGMSQFADGGMMSTKPYICSSNYVLKMSSLKRDKWCEVLDALYWLFIHDYKEYFRKNPRMSVMVSQLDKKDITLIKRITSRYLK
jgi:deoxyribodipyrimidine photolyase-related protein